jgi:hypothetical protein
MLSMKFLLTPVVLLLSIYSCKEPSSKSGAKNIDTAANKNLDPVTLREVKDYVPEKKRDPFFDTIGVSEAPVKILSKSLVEGEYTNYRNVRLAWKNVSSKKVAAVRFKWYGINAFNEPADMGASGFFHGFGGGFDDDPLSPGRKNSGTWEVYSKDARKIIVAWPYEVAFADGTVWKSK